MDGYHWYYMACSNQGMAKLAVQWCKRRDLPTRQDYNTIRVLLSDDQHDKHRDELESRYRMKGNWVCRHLHGLKLDKDDLYV